MAYFETRGSSVRAVVRVPGGGKKTATFDTKAEAELWANKMEDRKSRGEVTSASGRTNLELFEEYLETTAGSTDTSRWNKIRLNKLMLDPIAQLRVVETGTHHVNEWIARRLTKVSGATVQRELNLLSGTFRYAIKVRKWISVNPCHGANRPEEAPARNRPLLRDDEIEALKIATGYASDPDLQTKSARVGAMFLLSLETGMRSGEILRIRPEHYWRDRRTVHVAALEQGGRKSAKSGRAIRSASRNVPLSEAAIELMDQLLRTMPADQEPRPGQMMPPYLVGISDSSRDALWRKAVKKAGVEDRHFHDMKHDAATRMARFLDVLELSHALGIKDVRLLRDTYYVSDASKAAARLPRSLKDST